MVKRTFMILLAVVAILMLFSHREAGAVANGNGICEQNEKINFDCGQLGPNAIEFVGAKAGTCLSSIDFTQIPCTVYFYRYNGSAQNQLNVAIPLKLTQVVNDKYEVNCSDYITDGSGDPTTGFGKNFFNLGICRRAPTETKNPPAPPPDVSWTFFIAADPSFPDKTMPLAWQLKQGRDVYAASIVGPATSQPPVFESGATVSSSGGGTITYQISGDQVTITDGTGRVIPMEQTKLCLPAVVGQTPTFFKNGINFVCETISFATEQCDIKTTGADPCRWVAGKCIQY